MIRSLIKFAAPILALVAACAATPVFAQDKLDYPLGAAMPSAFRFSRIRTSPSKHASPKTAWSPTR